MDGRISRVADAAERARLAAQSLSIVARAALFAGIVAVILWRLPI